VDLARSGNVGKQDSHKVMIVFVKRRASGGKEAHKGETRETGKLRRGSRWTMLDVETLEERRRTGGCKVKTSPKDTQQHELSARSRPIILLKLNDNAWESQKSQ